MALAESVSYIFGFCADLNAEESCVVGTFAVHQRHKTQIGKFLFPAIGDGDFSRALHSHIAFVGVEIVGRQAFDQTAAFDSAHGHAHAVHGENELVIRVPSE